MSDINFDLTKIAKDKPDLLGRNMALGAGLGGVGGLLQGRQHEKGDMENALRGMIEENKRFIPQTAINKTEEILGNPELFNFKTHNTDLNNLNMVVHEALPKEEIIRDLLNKAKADLPLTEKIMSKLKYLGRPAAVGAAIGFTTPFVTTVIENIFSKGHNPVNKDDVASNLAKSAGEAIVDSIIEDMEKKANAEHIDKIVDGNLFELINNLGR